MPFSLAEGELFTRVCKRADVGHAALWLDQSHNMVLLIVLPMLYRYANPSITAGWKTTTENTEPPKVEPPLGDET